MLTVTGRMAKGRCAAMLVADGSMVTSTEVTTYCFLTVMAKSPKASMVKGKASSSFWKYLWRLEAVISVLPSVRGKLSTDEVQLESESESKSAVWMDGGIVGRSFARIVEEFGVDGQEEGVDDVDCGCEELVRIHASAKGLELLGRCLTAGRVAVCLRSVGVLRNKFR